MIKRLLPAIIILTGIGLLPLSFARAGYIRLPAAGDIAMFSPAACPNSGCAAGQRLTLHTDFPLNPATPEPTATPEATPIPQPTPNTRVCVYTSTAWNVDLTSFSIDAKGGMSNMPYASAPAEGQPGACPAPPNDFSLLGGVTATIPAGAFGDSLNFSFRIGEKATAAGTVLVQVAEQSGNPGVWSAAENTFTSIPVVAVATTAYVANNPADCGVNSPCYVDSSGDLAEGVGTGLKDAIDVIAQNSTINVLGAYVLKSKTITINKSLTLQGVNNAQLTYNGTVCTDPMLSLKIGTNLRNLVIDGGTTCPDTSRRDLVTIDTKTNNAADVYLENNDFIHGKNAITIADQAANVFVRYNNVTSNTGLALTWAAGNPGGKLFATANNFYANQSGIQVECNNRGDVNHNYWGSGVAIADGALHCTASDGKRLGAPIQHRTGLPGVDAQKIQVHIDKAYYFNNEIGLKHSDEGADFDVYVVNHGAGSNENVPFQGAGPQAISPCSNYWDVFLADGATPTNTLNVFFKYNYMGTGCIDLIETTSYCNQTDQALYPLWWYDPASHVTNGWDTTGRSPTGSGANGASGQGTACHTDENEIEVKIDSSGRPNLATDLRYLPFVIGIQTYLTPTPSRTATRTPTRTQTRTPTTYRTPTKTATFYYYYSPTPTRTRTPTKAPTSSSSNPTSAVPGYPANPTSEEFGYPAPSDSGSSTPGTSGGSGYPAPGVDTTASPPAASTSGTPPAGSRTPSPTNHGGLTITPAASRTGGKTSIPKGTSGVSSNTSGGGPAKPQSLIQKWNTSRIPFPPKQMVVLSLIIGAVLGLGSFLTAGWYLFLHRIEK